MGWGLARKRVARGLATTALTKRGRSQNPRSHCRREGFQDCSLGCRPWPPVKPANQSLHPRSSFLMIAKPVRCLMMTSCVGQWFQELGRATADNLSFRGISSPKAWRNKTNFRGTTRVSRSSDLKSKAFKHSSRGLKAAAAAAEAAAAAARGATGDNAILLDRIGAKGAIGFKTGLHCGT